MDELIAEKASIYNELVRKKSEGKLTQYDAVDLKQEFERRNFIMNHVIRGYTNPAGKWAAMAVFGSVGLGYWLSTRPSRGSLLSLRSSFTLPVYVGASLFLAAAFAKRRLGDRKEKIRFSQIRDESYEIDEKFYEVLDSLKKEDLKY
jgi:hypothetical protein